MNSSFLFMYSFDKSKIQERFTQCLESFKKSISGVSAKVSPSLLDAIRCEVYGSMTPISSIANITIVDSRTLSVKIWDASAVQSVYKAIQASNLGTNPVLEGSTIMLPLPPMSTERRTSMIDIVKQNAENAKVAIRNVRRDENDTIKLAQKNKEISEDEQKRYETEVQKLVDSAISSVDDIVKSKTEELTKV
jgi:ribosome recycling factor